jgi:hypothetical protein
MKRNGWLGAILLFAVCNAAWGQGTGASPNPDGTGPTLAATLQVIQTIVSQQGKLSWVTNYHDSADGTNWNYALTFEITSVTPDAAACTIAYHYKITRDSAAVADEDATVNLHDVHDLMLTTGNQRQDKNDAAAGHVTWSAKTTPNIFDLVIRETGSLEYYFFFTDEDTANRATKAMGHAVDLCGGSRGSF